MSPVGRVVSKADLADKLSDLDDLLAPNALEASLAQPGLLLVGTDGRGAFYADASAAIMAALEECERDAEAEAEAGGALGAEA